jgi:hypothetical protein
VTECESRVRVNGYGMRDLIDIRYTGWGVVMDGETDRQTDRQGAREREREWGHRTLE